MLQGGKQCSVNGPLAALPAATVQIIGLDSLPLFVCIGQLDIAIRELDGTQEYFETIRNQWIRRAEARQRCLACRIVPDNRQGVCAEGRCYAGRQQQVEPVVPRAAYGCAQALIGLGSVSKRCYRRRQRIDAQCRDKQRAVIMKLQRRRCCGG